MSAVAKLAPRADRRDRVAAERTRALALADQVVGEDFARAKFVAGLEAMAPNSIAAMVSDVRHYRLWAAKLELAPLPLEESVLGRYLDGLERSGRRPSTAERRLASLGRLVRLLGEREQLRVLHSDYVRDKLRGYQRRKGVKVRKAAPIVHGDVGDPIGGEGINLMALVAACGPDLRGRRDAALLSLLYAGGLRVSELVALDVSEFRSTGEGPAALFLRSSKTDQLGEGCEVAIPPRIARFVEHWISEAGIGQAPASPLFRRVLPRKVPVPFLPEPKRFGRALGQYVGEMRRFEADRAAARRVPARLEPGPGRLGRQGVLHIVRRVVAAAIDGGYVDIGDQKRSDVIGAIGTHSFRVGLTHDLFARNFDLGRVMLAQRWSSPTTAIGYARDLAGRSSAVSELFEQLAGEKPGEG